MATHHHIQPLGHPHPPHPKSGVCPSCGEETVFRYNGQQKWPEHIAETMNIPPIITLWNCDICHSTISDNALEDE